MVGLFVANIQKMFEMRKYFLTFFNKNYLYKK